MTARFSEDYYRKYWDRFLVKVPGEDYRNLEAELEREMNVYSDIHESAVAIIRKMEAKKIADSCEKLVRKEMEICKRLESGKSSFGYTTQSQEIAARGELRKRFEFNCLQLKDFKEKYL